MSSTLDTSERETTEVELRRNTGLSAIVAIAASAVAIAYLTRAIGGGGALAWVLCVVFGVVAVSQLRALVDARTPLMIADEQGMRLRLGREWRGLRWSDIDRVEIEPGAPFRDGRLVIQPHEEEHALDGLESTAQRQVAWSRKLYGAPLALPLGMTTRVSSTDLVSELAGLAAGRAEIAELAAPDKSRRARGATLAEGEPEVEETDASADSGVDQETGAQVDDRGDVALEEPDELDEPEEPERMPFFGYRAPDPEDVAETDGSVPGASADERAAGTDDDEMAVAAAVAGGTAGPSWAARARRRLAGLVSRSGRHGDLDRIDDAEWDAVAAPHDDAGEVPQEAPRTVVDEAGTTEAATTEAGTDEAGTDEVATTEAGTDEAGTDEAGADEVAAAEPGGAGERPVFAAYEAAPAASRDARPASRIDVTLPTPSEQVVRERREARIRAEDEAISLVEIPAQREAEPVAVVEPDTEAQAEPVIGAKLRHARERVGVSIERLSERTAIRPHIIESIERDDFDPCGGDFYARGHLRTLARAVGLDPAVLVDEYDAHFAHAPIAASEVFEAELATSVVSTLRTTSAGGPRWSLLVGSVLALVLVWSLARIFAPPADVAVHSPSVSDSAGLTARQGAQQPIVSPKVMPRRLLITATAEAGRVVVRDASGTQVWAGHLAAGQHRRVIGLAPFTVRSPHGSAVSLTLDGQPRGTVGTTDVPASRVLK